MEALGRRCYRANSIITATMYYTILYCELYLPLSAVDTEAAALRDVRPRVDGANLEGVYAPYDMGACRV